MPLDPDEVRRRVAIVRLAYSRADETARSFAQRLGFGETQWNNWENSQRISVDGAARLVEQIEGLTLDWLYLGDKSSMSFPIRDALTQAELRLSSEEGTTKSPGRLAGAGGSTKPSRISRARSKTQRA